jgi:hypothetical protein
MVHETLTDTITDDYLGWLETSNGWELRLGGLSPNLGIFWQSQVIWLNYFGQTYAARVQEVKAAKFELVVRLASEARNLLAEV